MSDAAFNPVEGTCSCRGIRYRMTAAPMLVHCCHCTWCQRETGSAFVLNAMVEAECVDVLAGSPLVIDTPSSSGRGQKISRCPTCYVALWSNYPGGGPAIRFVREGVFRVLRSQAGVAGGQSRAVQGGARAPWHEVRLQR